MGVNSDISGKHDPLVGLEKVLDYNLQFLHWRTNKEFEKFHEEENKLGIHLFQIVHRRAGHPVIQKRRNCALKCQIQQAFLLISHSYINLNSCSLKYILIIFVAYIVI